MWISWKFPDRFRQCSLSRQCGRVEVCKRREWGSVTKAGYCIKTWATRCTNQTQQANTEANKENHFRRELFFSLFELLFLFFHQKSLIMRFCTLALLVVVGISVQDGWSLPLNSVFVTFPGDVVKNMTDIELAEVSDRWLCFALVESKSCSCLCPECAGQ